MSPRSTNPVRPIPDGAADPRSRPGLPARSRGSGPSRLLSVPGSLQVMAITPSRQRNAVSEGGTSRVMCGQSSLAWDKLGLDLAFEATWRVWRYRWQFPQVDTDVRHGSDGLWVMTRADVRKRTRNLYWDTSGPDVVIHPRSVWSDGEIDAVEAARLIDGDVPAEVRREALQVVSLFGTMS